MSNFLHLQKWASVSLLLASVGTLQAREPGSESAGPTTVPGGGSLQKVLEEADRSLTRPDGLYRGTVTILRREESPVVRDFELIRRGKSAYLSLRSVRRGEELRLLWTGQGLTVWSFDVVRRILSRPEERQLFEVSDETGFAPVDFFFPWFAANVVPENLREDSLDGQMQIIVGRTLTGSWQGRIGIGVDPGRRPLRMEISDAKGILLRVLEFRAGRPVLEWKTNREFLPPWPSLFELMDVHHGRISRFETRIHDPGFRPDPAIFDPDFLSR